jgi:hypothetical protein
MANMRELQLNLDITISSTNPYFGTKEANDNRYREDIVKSPLKKPRD